MSLDESSEQVRMITLEELLAEARRREAAGEVEIDLNRPFL